ncbi:PIR Superfamily Protein [Plasmodium ovale wallikeri]|uniref:PIR Superfamily Protein n=2 Tax=Plasmodium ovale TaxID=36330 RepID=A0A1A9AHU2_PLAOA|nr:PIR Superfamily Protein [Plasmodium ovale wallikeri]SBT56162.1 PIR Superfamily Protein [Plasmodium ovale wallikeri]SBT73093.1 PIR protein [Plasmodium ovale]
MFSFPFSEDGLKRSFEEHDELKGLPLYDFCKILDKDDTEGDQGYCLSKWSDTEDNYFTHSDLCYKLRRNLINLKINSSDQQLSTPIDVQHKYKYLKYWFNDYKLNYYLDEQTLSIFSNIWRDYCHENSIEIDCKFYFNKLYQKEDQLMEILIDFYEYYNNANYKDSEMKQEMKRNLQLYISDDLNTYQNIDAYCKENDNSRELCNKFLQHRQEENKGLGELHKALHKQAEVQIPGTYKERAYPYEEETLQQQESETGGNTSGTVAGVLITMTGISTLLLILYKFTPFGTWLRPIIRKEKMFDNFDIEETDESSLENFQNDNASYINEKYNIAYYSS